MLQNLYRTLLKRLKIGYNRIRSKYAMFDVAELFFQHNGETDFNRYDMIVRLLAVENYYGKNDYGFNFYMRMQGARVNKEWVEPSVNKFKKLIQSYENNGYNNRSRIVLDSELHLVDGSHRMAMAMYYGIPYINAEVRYKVYNIFYGIEWFRINGFTENECKILRLKYEELKKRYETPFICSIWPPFHNYFTEITEKLSLFGTIIDIKEIYLNEQNYSIFVK